MEAFNDAIIEAHAYMSNPLRPYMFWSADARAGKAVLTRHDQQLERKVEVAFKAAPPDHTIAGEGDAWRTCSKRQSMFGVWAGKRYREEIEGSNATQGQLKDVPKVACNQLKLLLFVPCAAV
jgi:hypothetical protein